MVEDTFSIKADSQHGPPLYVCYMGGGGVWGLCPQWVQGFASSQGVRGAKPLKVTRFQQIQGKFSIEVSIKFGYTNDLT